MKQVYRDVFETVVFAILIVLCAYISVMGKKYQKQRMKESIIKEVFLDNSSNIEVNTSPSIYEYYEIKKVDLKPTVKSYKQDVAMSIG